MAIRKSVSYVSLGVLLAVLGGLFLMPGQAEARGFFERRDQNHHARIHQGIKNGSLTRQEARGLYHQQRHINHMERRYRADGHMSPGERRNLQIAEHRMNRNLIRQKHDNQRRYW